MSNATRPRLAIVGAGRVGQSLGRLLVDAGYPISEVVCRSAKSARAAVRFIGAGRAVGIRSLGALEAAVVLLTVPDDAIRATAERLSEVWEVPEGAVALHTSGSRGASELEPLAARGVHVGSMHPLQSFASPELGVARVTGSVFAIEGDRRAVAVARRLALAVGGRPVRLRAGTKALYHAAAVLAAGHVTALLDMSLEGMQSAGMTEDEALQAILPLVKGTISNIEANGTAAALTGPFARGDEGTIEKNRTALAALDARIAEIYDALGARSRALAARRRRGGE